MQYFIHGTVEALLQGLAWCYMPPNKQNAQETKKQNTMEADKNMVVVSRGNLTVTKNKN